MSPPDLRRHSTDAVVERVQHRLGTRFDLATEVRKRRSIGFRTDRDTWVRVEIRDLSRWDGQGWGVEAAAVLDGVATPTWHQGLSWVDRRLGVVWRADETDLVVDPPVRPGGVLTSEPELSESWWATFDSSLTALAEHPTTRVATLSGRRVTQDRITMTIHRVFPEVDTTVTEWTAAHADLAWANLTAPTCWLLDWEDWGLAPRGFDAATLWTASLAVPPLAERVHEHRRADLDTRAGRLARLFMCAGLIAAGPDYAGPLWEPAQAGAAVLTGRLTST